MAPNRQILKSKHYLTFGKKIWKNENEKSERLSKNGK